MMNCLPYFSSVNIGYVISVMWVVVLHIWTRENKILLIYIHLDDSHCNVRCLTIIINAPSQYVFWSIKRTIRPKWNYERYSRRNINISRSIDAKIMGVPISMSRLIWHSWIPKADLNDLARLINYWGRNKMLPFSRPFQMHSTVWLLHQFNFLCKLCINLEQSTLCSS